MFVPDTLSRPPADMAIPYTEQLIFTIATQIPFVLFFARAIENLVRRGDSTALFFGIGGFLSSAFEPFVDVLGFCYFPREGSWVAYEWLGRPIPIFVPATYGWFVGGMGYWCYNIIRDENTTRRDIWVLWFKFFIINLILEYPPLYFGIYTYYGYQPFEVLRFPLWFPAVNAITPMVAGSLVNLLTPHFKGFNKAAIISITASAYGMANAACGFPVWIALSTDLGYRVTYLGAVATAILLCTSVWIMSIPLPETRGIRLSEKR